MHLDYAMFYQGTHAHRSCGARELHRQYRKLKAVINCPCTLKNLKIKPRTLDNPWSINFTFKTQPIILRQQTLKLRENDENFQNFQI